MNRPLVSVIIPTLNEAASIGSVMDELLAVLPEAEVIVVDSGFDGTEKIARSKGAKVLKPQQKGYGAALRAGLSESSGEFVVFMDGDGTYAPSDILKVTSPLISGSAFLVSGCRFNSKPKSMSFIRYVGNVGINMIFYLLFGRKIKDTQTGMKAVRRNVLASMNLRENGMPFSTEVLAKAAKQNLEVLEVNIKYRERVGNSKLNPLKDGIRIVVYMLKERVFLKVDRVISSLPQVS